MLEFPLSHKQYHRSFCDFIKNNNISCFIIFKSVHHLSDIYSLKTCMIISMKTSSWLQQLKRKVQRMTPSFDILSRYAQLKPNVCQADSVLYKCVPGRQCTVQSVTFLVNNCMCIAVNNCTCI